MTTLSDIRSDLDDCKIELNSIKTDLTILSRNLEKYSIPEKIKVTAICSVGQDNQDVFEPTFDYRGDAHLFVELWIHTNIESNPFFSSVELALDLGDIDLATNLYNKLQKDYHISWVTLPSA